MDRVELEKRRLRLKRSNGYQDIGNEDKDKTKNYINGLISRLLLSLILFFGIIILSNTSAKAKSFIDEDILKENMSFSKVTNIYEKYFGNVIPFEDLIKDEQTVFNEKFQYESIVNYNDGYEVTVEDNYLVPVINSGIVVFIGEKEGLGNTVIIQGIDEVDYWYSNIANLSPSLYDYVSSGELLGTADGTKMYLTFKKDSECLEYNEVIE